MTIFLPRQILFEVDIPISGVFSLIEVRQVNLIETNDFGDILSDLSIGSLPLNLKGEQQDDEVIREVTLWKNRGSPDQSPYLPIALRKYRKQFSRPIDENLVL